MDKKQDTTTELETIKHDELEQATAGSSAWENVKEVGRWFASPIYQAGRVVGRSC